MLAKLYIGNVNYDITECELRKLFKDYEPIHSIILISDKESKSPRGFGFVELEEPKAVMAVNELNKKVYKGRNIVLSKALGREPRTPKTEVRESPLLDEFGRPIVFGRRRRQRDRQPITQARWPI